MSKLVIAIDGPAGAGKSTIAQLLADRLGYTYIDTGAMYRAVAWKTMQESAAAEAEIVKIARQLDIDLQFKQGKTRVFADGTEVTAAIRTPEVTELVPQVAQIGGVRAALLTAQRRLAERGAVVMDGRDIATHVLPQADVKIFLTASIDERAQRRGRELEAKGFEVDMAALKRDIAHRDLLDTQREIAPLVQAADAVLVDTTGCTIAEVLDKIMELCR